VRGVLDPAEIAAAAAAIEVVLAVHGPLAQVASGLGDPGSFTEDFRRCPRSKSGRRAQDA
jgi:hypothetical protein